MHYERQWELQPGLPFVPEWTTTSRLADRRAAWERLARNAVEPNPFYEPDYLIASARHIEGEDIRCLAIYRDGARDADLVGLFPFGRARLMQGALLPAFEFYANDYVCSTAPLIDKEAPEAVWRCMFAALERAEGVPKVLLASLMPARRGAFASLEAVLNEIGLAHTAIERSQRAAVMTPETSEALMAGLSSGRRKEMRRKARKLEEMGCVSYRSIVTQEGRKAAIEDFLKLEHSGWKGKTGTALTSRPESRAFAEAAFAADNVEIDCLALDGKPLAMTVNLVSGRAVFAIKTAYDESFSSLSPGVQLDIWTVGNVARQPERYDRIDSCAVPGHPIEAIWLDKEPILSLAIGTRAGVPQSRIEQFAMMMRNFARLKNWLREQFSSVKAG